MRPQLNTLTLVFLLLVGMGMGSVATTYAYEYMLYKNCKMHADTPIKDLPFKCLYVFPITQLNH